MVEKVSQSFSKAEKIKNRLDISFNIVQIDRIEEILGQYVHCPKSWAYTHVCQFGNSDEVPTKPTM
jgi:hypothetical protein